MKKDDLEDLFKKSFENFEAEVKPGVWKNIQTGLKGAGLGVLAKMLLNKIGTNAIVAIVSSAATVVGTVLVMNYSGNKTETSKSNTTTPPKMLAEKPAPVSVNQIKNFLTNPETNSSSKKEAVTNTNSAQIDNNSSVVSIKNDKKQIQKTISELSGDRIASISSSCVGGAVPLIVNLSNAGSGKINKWSFNDGTKSITAANPIKVFDTPGIYTIKLSSIGPDGKSAMDSIKVEVTGNSSLSSTSGDFTPNGDGYKDDFGFNPINMVSLNVEVFDNNSNIVYRSESLSAKWDGKNLKGKPVKEGVYFYILKAVGLDGKKYEQNGKITLKR